MKRRIFIAGIVGILIAFSFWAWRSDVSIWRFMPRAVAVVFGPKPVQIFSLVDHNGRSVTKADFTGKYLLVFFGYTYCPDVCPTALNDMSEVLDELGASGNSIVPLFISVDPKRDTPEHLKSYVENFHPRFIGLTGTSAQIAAAAQSYKVRYIKMEDEDGDPETYYMGHSSKVFFVGPTGELLISFSGSTQPAEMKSKIANLLSGEGR
ncbi:MAG: SCO family protein [Rhodospirillaceae bacterium]|nr:SCO family protein [Rhodospirillaceae bacterium]MBT5941894.1 SCO family protein [Rhodospirillaceae bacterium]MBT7956039.1 SCO family protein [Rhodospirillaceae bacterium]